MTNAVRYSGERGKKVFLSAYRNGKDIILEVRDEGVGIPQEDIRRVFEPFTLEKTVVHLENLLVWGFIL